MLLALYSDLNLCLDQEDSLGVSLDLVIPLLNVTTLNTSLFDLLTITYLPNWPIKESFWPSQWYLFSHHLMGLTGPRVPQSCGVDSVGELIVPGTLLKGLSSMFHATLTPKTLKKVQYVVLQTVAYRSHSGPPSCRFYTFFSLKRTFQQLPPFSLEDPIANHGHEYTDPYCLLYRRKASLDFVFVIDFFFLSRPQTLQVWVALSSSLLRHPRSRWPPTLRLLGHLGMIHEERICIPCYFRITTGQKDFIILSWFNLLNSAELWKSTNYKA